MRFHLLNFIVYSITILFSLILGVVVYIKNSHKKINIFFTLYVFSILIWIAANFFADSLLSTNQVLFWTKVGVIGPLLIGPTFLNLAHIFPNRHIKKSTSLLIWIPTLTLFLLVPGNAYIESISIMEWGADFIPGSMYSLFGIALFLYIMMGVRVLLKKNRKGSLYKTQAEFISIGAAITLLTGLLFSIILPIFGYSRLAILAPSSTLFLFAAIGYAIVKHKFLDISALVGRAISFTFLTIIVSGLYGLALFTISSAIPQQFQTFGNIAAALILASTFSKLKRLIQKTTQNALHITTYSSEKVLSDLGNIVNATLSLKKITQKTLHTLLKNLHITKGAFLLIESNSKQIVVEQFRWNPSPSMSLNKVHYLAKKSKGNPLSFDNLDEGKTKKILRDENVYMVIPLTTPNGNHGILMLGEKQSGNSYSNQDMEMLKVFQSQISMAIQNSLDYEKISHFNKTLREQIKIATEKLRKANRNLRHLDKVKDEFVYIATHELKNPVTAMRGYLSMMNEGSFGKIPKGLQDPLEQLNQSNQQLVNLVNDLLQIARAEAKTLRVNISQVNICIITSQAIANLKPLADQKKLSIKYTHAKNDITIDADPDRLKEVFNNLITNAIKYSDKGAITINHVTEGNLIITHVKDHGVGIAKKDQKKIFTRFFRVDEEVLKGVPGSGLGLFIVRQLVEKMGGKIWFTTKYGEGTTFSFSLPKA